MGHNQGGSEGQALKISQKGLYALQAIMTLARRHDQGAIKIRDIAAESDLPEKFLELILLEMKNARIVDSVRGARGGYRLRRDPSELPLSDIIRLIDGPLAPMGDAEQLRGLIAKDADHRALYEVFPGSAGCGSEDSGEYDDRGYCGRREGQESQNWGCSLEEEAQRGIADESPLLAGREKWGTLAASYMSRVSECDL